MIAAALTWLCSALQTLNIDHVFDYDPFQPDGTLSPDTFAQDGTLHFWTVLRATARRQENGENDFPFSHTIHLEGRLALQGSASMQQINDEIDAILTLFQQDDTLGGTVDTVLNAQLVESRPYSYLTNLVHYARIELVIETT